MGLLLACAGDWERGCAVAESAMRLNPHFPGWYRLAGIFNAYRTHDYRAAIDGALRMQMPGYFWISTACAAAFGQLGEQQHARRALDELLAIERDFGRERPYPGAPRTLDLDLILYGDAVVDEPGLRVPHPRFRERFFVLGPLAELLDPEFVTPLVTYLCSEQCESTHEIFDVGGGRYARIFIGLTPGWTAPKGKKPSAEDLRDNMKQIRSTERYVIPDSIAEEMKAMAELMNR